MKRIIDHLDLLEPQLVRWVGALGLVKDHDGNPVDGYRVQGLAESIRRKVAFATTHLALLRGIPWSSVPDIGRPTPPRGQVKTISINFTDGTLELRTKDAVESHVYLATDGLVAAVANLLDTFARLLCATYLLKLPARQATLLTVRDKCASPSPLGDALKAPAITSWLESVRVLRGECQHADISNVLRQRFGTNGEPLVDRVYCWLDPTRDRPITVYATDCVDALADTFEAACIAIRNCPTDPTK